MTHWLGWLRTFGQERKIYTVKERLSELFKMEEEEVVDCRAKRRKAWREGETTFCRPPTRHRYRDLCWRAGGSGRKWARPFWGNGILCCCLRREGDLLLDTCCHMGHRHCREVTRRCMEVLRVPNSVARSIEKLIHPLSSQTQRVAWRCIQERAHHAQAVVTA